MNRLGQILKMVRTGRDMKQKELADSVGVSESYISALELGKREPTWLMIICICEALQVSPALVILVAQDDDEDVAPFVHAAYAMLWKQIRIPF